jgi:hypothetical protein
MPISYASVLMGVSASRPEARGWDAAHVLTAVMTDVRLEDAGAL